ncbi:MAG: hypothetical protein LBQ88_08370 [Treponema sp.]|nr:hypothetical protein [Treponema sp.]
MKKISAVVFLAFLLLSFLNAQDRNPGRTPIRSRYYEVYAAEDMGKAVSDELESRFDVYNRLFRFDPALLPAPLRVRVFYDKAEYDAYITARLGSSRPGAVYLHYNQPDRRELIIHQNSSEKDRMLPHQAFIQYLRGFVPYPPAWMREGFSIYFNTLKYSRTGSNAGALSYEENLSWLETVKSQADNLPSLESVLLADTMGAPDHFQSFSWALVSFFLNSGNTDYFRTLVECIMLLSPNATAAENSQAVKRRIDLWIKRDAFDADCVSYFKARKTFAELIAEGEAAYNAKEKVDAELSFLAALIQRPSHYAPYYYLGLLAYEDKNYEAAEQYYRSSLEYGGDKALVSYALGINAASAGRNADAVSYLQQAAAASPDRYKARAERLIERLIK